MIPLIFLVEERCYFPMGVLKILPSPNSFRHISLPNIFLSSENLTHKLALVTFLALELLLCANFGSLMVQGDTPQLTLLGKSLVTHGGMRYSNAWATAIVEAPNGDLLCAYEDSTSEYVDQGVIDLKRSSDGGSTWASPNVVCDDTYRCAEPQFLRRDNRLYLFWAEMQMSGGQSTIKLKHSDDSGYTWSSATAIYSGNYAVMSADPIVCQSGRWVLAFYHRGTATYFTSSVLYSDNQGSAWIKGGDVPSANAAVCEPAIVELSDGTLLMYMRDDNYPNGGKFQYMSKSNDGGLSWSAPVAAIQSPRCQSQMLKLHDGSFAITWPDVSSPANSPRYPFVLRISTDDCTSWSPSLIIESGSHDFSNHGMCQRSNGEVIVAYSDDTTLTDIYCARVKISGTGDGDGDGDDNQEPNIIEVILNFLKQLGIQPQYIVIGVATIIVGGMGFIAIRSRRKKKSVVV